MLQVLLSPWFWAWYAFFFALVVSQAVAAYFDGYAVPMRLFGRLAETGETYLEHGGMWADMFIVSPLVAYILATHHLLLPRWGLLLGVLALVLASMLGYTYHFKGRMLPHLHAHDGKTTIAGWLHNVYTVFALFVILMFYAEQVTPLPTRVEGMWCAAALSIFAFLGIVRFSPHWRARNYEVTQVLLEVLLIWTITYVLFLV